MSSAVAFRRLRPPVSFGGGAEVSTAAFLTDAFPLVDRLVLGVSSASSVASVRFKREDRRGVGSGDGSRGGSGVGVLFDAIS